MIKEELQRAKNNKATSGILQFVLWELIVVKIPQ